MSDQVSQQCVETHGKEQMLVKRTTYEPGGSRFYPEREIRTK